MDKSYQEAPLPSGVAFKICGFFDDVKGREKFFNSSDQYKGKSYSNFESSRKLQNGREKYE